MEQDTVQNQQAEQEPDAEKKANKQRGELMTDCGSQETAAPQTPECEADPGDGDDSRTPTDESPEDTPSPETETPDDGNEATPSTDDGNEATPSTDDGSDVTSPTDDGNDPMPPTDGNDSAPPTDDGSETTPPTDDGNDSAPPTDGNESVPPTDGNESAPPTDGNESAPPTDGNESAPPTDGNESAPPTDGNESAPPTDGNESAPPTDNQTVESPIDGGTARLATVTEVVDGDTVKVEFRNGSVDTVQLLGVDTPAMTKLGTSPEKYGIPNTAHGREWLVNYSHKAKTFAENELAGQTVLVVTDPQLERQGSNRLSVYIYYGSEYNTVFQQRLLEQGYARVYTDATFVLEEKFVSIEETAKENNVGLWGYESPPTNETPTNETPTNETPKNGILTNETLETGILTNETATNGISTNGTLTFHTEER